MRRAQVRAVCRNMKLQASVATRHAAPRIQATDHAPSNLQGMGRQAKLDLATLWREVKS